MPWGTVHTATPPRGEKGSVQPLQKPRRAVRNNLREETTVRRLGQVPWKSPIMRGLQAGDPVRSEGKWENTRMGSSSSIHPTPDFQVTIRPARGCKISPSPEWLGEMGWGKDCSTQGGGHRRRPCQALSFSQLHLWKIS